MDYEAPFAQPPGKLHLPDDIRERLTAIGPEWWPTRVPDDILARLDFGWLQALQQFDHWSLYQVGRLKDQPAQSVRSLPLPNYIVFQWWAKLRFALALRRGDFAQASAEVRHLGDLLRSQRRLVSEMIAVVIYTLDVIARERAEAAGYDVSSWPQGDREQLDLVRPVAFAARAFTHSGVSEQTMRKALACMPSPCATLAEGVRANRSLGAFGSTDNFEILQQLAAERGCEGALLERMAWSAELGATEALDELDGELGGVLPRMLEHWP